ncbi:DUF2508 domain-containing protein [Paenibacillus sp. CAA11]|uniref:DUF2508 family protein n=1 Tax=Paenibacillus sp. CAA11 TaxID=1532905 RepID=UPI000D3AD113|nr:DUF2508 family protein [Paenibacillus sp. CAA11]AWB42896.1 DUF2508 domain-containing protein [Paenibacillus sp. CAA11]
MNFLKRWIWTLTQGRRPSPEEERRDELYEELRKAHREWERARMCFEHARGKDEVDYAIYILEAAERKYQIHLKEAKKSDLQWGAFKYGQFVEKRIAERE